MSKSLSAFMRPNVAEIKNASFAPSPRFVGEDGKPVEWEIRCISADEYARIRSGCIRQVPVPGKKNQFTAQLNTYGQRHLRHRREHRQHGQVPGGER